MRQQGKQRFTLIELLVVIAIIAILAAMLLPAMKQAKATAIKAQCTNNLRQLFLSWSSYCDDHNERLPMMYSYFWGGSPIKYWPYYMSDYLETAVYLTPTNIKMIHRGSFLACPALQLPIDWSTRYPDYGMNKWGIGGGDPHISTIGYKTTGDVVRPAEQAAFCDAHYTSNPSFDPFPVFFYVDALYGHDFRHNEQINLLYCDGHVESHDRSIKGTGGWWNKVPWGNLTK